MNKKTKKLVMFVALLLLLLGVGYATFYTNLSIEGTTEIVNNNFVIKFENIVEKEGSVTATKAASLSNDTKLTFDVSLANPGEYYGFSVDIKNAGFLDAMIESITMTQLTEEQQKYLTFEVTDKYGIMPVEKQLLSIGETRTINILLTYKSEPEAYPDSSSEAIKITLDIKYVEADDTAISSDIIPVQLGNVFAPAWVSAPNRISAQRNMYLTAGTVITLIDSETYKYAVVAQDSENIVGTGSSYVNGGWDTSSFTITTSGWYGFALARNDDADFALGTTDSKYLNDYITTS